MKASDVIKRKDKDEDKTPKGKKNSLIDWISKRRGSAKKATPSKGDDDGDEE